MTALHSVSVLQPCQVMRRDMTGKGNRLIFLKTLAVNLRMTERKTSPSPFLVLFKGKAS
jgi:hypothetical protein